MTCCTVETVHFWSDEPSKQYKNKKNFLLICVVPPRLDLKMQRGISFQRPMARVPLMALGQPLKDVLTA